MLGLGMKKSSPRLQVRQNGRVTFDRRKGSSPFFFFLNKKWPSTATKQFADWLIELANGCFSLSKDGFFKSVKTFLNKELGIYAVLRQPARKVVSEFHNFFIPFPFIKFSSSQYTILPIKIYCVSLNNRAFPIRVPYNGHTINLLEAVQLKIGHVPTKFRSRVTIKAPWHK